MARILMLDTSTEVCSAALSENGILIAERENTEGYRHSALLTLFISELLSETGWSLDRMDAICVSRGPGSYTGLRIGVSVAKGLCYGSGIPLMAVSSLHSMADHVSRNLSGLTEEIHMDALLCPMLDARRMEIFTAFYNRSGQPLTDIHALVVHRESFQEELTAGKIIFFGNGAGKCHTVIHHPNAVFLGGIHASARFMSLPAQESFLNRKFENVAYFEPFYLKDFVATVPKNKVLWT